MDGCFEHFFAVDHNSLFSLRWIDILGLEHVVTRSPETSLSYSCSTTWPATNPNQPSHHGKEL